MCKDCGESTQPGTCDTACKWDFFHNAYSHWIFQNSGRYERSKFVPPPCKAGKKCHKKHDTFDPTDMYVQLKMENVGTPSWLGDCLVTGRVTRFSYHELMGEGHRTCPGIIWIEPIQIRPLNRSMFELIYRGLCDGPWDPSESWKKFLWYNKLATEKDLYTKIYFNEGNDYGKQCSFTFVSEDRAKNYFSVA